MTEPAAATSRVFVTPRTEVDVTCRLALAAYLGRRVPEASDLAREWLLQRDPLTPLPCPVPPQVARGRDCKPPSPPRGGTGQGGGEGFQRVDERWQAIYPILRDITIVDLACGEGHFLVGMLDVLDELGCRAAHHLGLADDDRRRRRRIVERNLYGVEVQERVLAQTRRRLRRAAGTENALQLASGDSLVERPAFHWNSRFPDVAERGGFDLVVGNPPYLRHERIADPLGELTRQDYKRRAMKAVHARFPSFFGWDPERAVAAYPLDGRSDLSLLFTFLGLSLLRPDGVLGFVLPIATLDARYGRRLTQFLQQSDRDVLILESRRQRSFADAGVNTAVLVIFPSNKNAEPSASVRHVRVDAPLRQVNLADVIACQTRAEPAAPDRRAADSSRAEAESLSLRLLDRLGPRMTSLGSLGRLRYPIKSGINRFFYPGPEVVARFGIEPEFLHPVLKSPGDVRTIAVRPSDLRSVLFSCRSALEELEEQGKLGAVAYIRWGGEQRTASGVPWPRVPSVRGRAHWYAIPLLQPAGVICPRLFHRRYFFVAPTTPILEDQTFYGLLLEQRRRNVVAALLNSSLTYLFVETLGRTGLGDGVLQHALGDMATLPVLDPRSLSDALIRDLTASFQPLAARPILPIEEEVKQGDRVALDEVVAAGAGMREAEMREVRETLVELASQRQERAQSLARSRRATSSKAATRSSRIAVACWTVSGVNSRS